MIFCNSLSESLLKSRIQTAPTILKIVSGQCEISVDKLNKIAKYFGMTIDQIVNFDGTIPQEITEEDKILMERVKMIQELEPEEKTGSLKWWIPF